MEMKNLLKDCLCISKIRPKFSKILNKISLIPLITFIEETQKK